MLKPLKMPQIALGADEVTAREWRLEPGAEFAAGDPILEIETDKAAMDVEAPFAGLLVERRCEEGDVVAVGDVYGYVADPGTALDDALAELAEHAAATTPEPATVADAPAQAAVAAADGPARINGAHAAAGSTAGELIPFLVVEHGELAGLPEHPPVPAGQPPAAPSAPAPAAAASPAPDPASLDDREAAGPGTERALSRRRLAIGRRTSVATQIPTFTVTREVATGPARAAVAAAREQGQRATVTDVLLGACARAGMAHPEANAWMLEGVVLELEHVNVALAVDAPGGVMAPVVRAAEALDLAAIAAARADLVARARDGELENRELAGATMTLSNVAGLGAHGITPVLTVPQVIALGVGMARGSGDAETIEVALVADHRALDGADGARFLTTFAEFFEAPPDLTGKEAT